jgi:hypothetical protein
MAIESKGVPAMSDLHDLQARAGDLERAITETDDRHGSLLSGLENGLSQLRERLVGATATNDRLARENTELKAIAEQLLGAFENKPAQTLHDKLAALDGQLHGLLELSGIPAPADGAPVNGTPVNGTPVNGTPVAAGDDDGTPSASTSASESESAGESAGGSFELIRQRMRALSSQLLAPSTSTTGPLLPEIQGQAQAQDQDQGSVQDQVSAPMRHPAAGPPPKPEPERQARRDPKSPRAFDRPIRALAEKAQNVLPKVHLRFDAETDYALTILRRIRGGRQPFGIEEVRELINGKFGLTLTDRDDAQLSASLANQDGLTRGPRNGGDTHSWRFVMG